MVTWHKAVHFANTDAASKQSYGRFSSHIKIEVQHCYFDMTKMLFVLNDNCSMTKTNLTPDNWNKQERLEVGISKPHSVTQPLSHSATQPLSHSATQPLSHSATQPLSHSATQLPSHLPTQHPLTHPIGNDLLQSREHTYSCSPWTHRDRRHCSDTGYLSIHQVLSTNKPRTGEFRLS